MGDKMITHVPDVLNKKDGKSVGGEGTGDRSFKGEQSSAKHDKHIGLKPINKKTIMTEKGVGGPISKAGGPVVGCGKGKK